MFLHVEIAKIFCSIIRKSLYFVYVSTCFSVIFDFIFFLFYTLFTQRSFHDFETINEFCISIFKF